VEIIDGLGGIGTLAPGTALVVLLYWLIRSVGTGKLIPGEMHDRIVDQYKREAERKDTTIDRLLAQQDKLQSTSETSLRLVRAFPTVTEGGDES